MKSIKKYLYNVLILLTLSMLIVSCDIKNPVDGIEVRLNTITRETLVTGYVYDAASGKSIEQDVVITFSGMNAIYIVDETNDATQTFTVKGGFFNFAIKDGITITENTPFKVVANVKSNGYLDLTFPLVITSKGTQGVTFFIAKPQDFSEDISTNSYETGNADNNGTVQDTVTTIANDGSEVTIPAETNLTTSDGDPLQGNLTTSITTVIYNQENTSIQPQNTTVNGNEAIAPLMSLNVVVSDDHGNTASNISQPIQTSIPLQEALINPVTGHALQVGDSIPIWYLKPDGNYGRTYPSAYISSTGTGLKKRSSTKETLTLHAYIVMVNSFLGFIAPASVPKFIVNNPRPGYSLQVFMGVSGSYAPIAFSGQVNGEEIVLPEDNYPDIAYSVLFKYGANPVDASGGFTFASTNWNTSSSGSAVPVTFDYPQESIQANVKITGVCTDKDPIIRTYPSITFNYREKGTDTWLQGSLTDGVGVISGLVKNKTYEAKATYRDEEATVEINVITPTNFTISAGENQGSLLRAEVKGTSQVNDLTYVNIEIDIDLKGNCD